MTTLRVELRGPRGWAAMGPDLPAGSGIGSLSDHTPQGRQMLVFFCTERFAAVTRSLAGVDFEVGPARVVDTAGLEVLARLKPGEEYAQWVRMNGGDSLLVRWTCCE